MTKDYSKIAVGIAASLLTLCLLCLGLDLAVSFYNDNIKEKPIACPPLPKTFTQSNLIGTWIGNYFGNIDTLIIRADGTYKQIYSSDYLSLKVIGKSGIPNMTATVIYACIWQECVGVMGLIVNVMTLVEGYLQTRQQ
jgi:hypothetical protein